VCVFVLFCCVNNDYTISVVLCSVDLESDTSTTYVGMGMVRCIHRFCLFCCRLFLFRRHMQDYTHTNIHAHTLTVWNDTVVLCRRTQTCITFQSLNSPERHNSDLSTSSLPKAITVCNVPVNDATGAISAVYPTPAAHTGTY
jgi:hypothetical protein